METNAVARPPSTVPKVEAMGVQKVFYDRLRRPLVCAIRDLNLEVRQREFAVLLGPSGCGKSTFLHLVAGVEKASGGQLLVDGQPVQGPGRDRGIVFQEHALFPWKSVLGNVRYGLDVGGVPRQRANETALHFINLVGLTGFEQAYPHTLSGGMKQRVAIARALAYDPDLLLMDEPFGALDAQTRAFMIDDLARIHAETLKTVLFVTHSVEEALLLADRIFIFSARPCQVKKVLSVDLPRPRQVVDARLRDLQTEIMAILSPEVKRMLDAENKAISAAGAGG
ncbi:MAG: ABC transporter ATP-binding protein [Chloroflexi bacterium]|nr:ABC transporter ATP-binding protein [Chloroflexota bacterium]